jgi:hypothetical protein
MAKRAGFITKTYLHENGISTWNAVKHISPNMLHTYTIAFEKVIVHLLSQRNRKFVFRHWSRSEIKGQ